MTNKSFGRTIPLIFQQSVRFFLRRYSAVTGAPLVPHTGHYELKSETTPNATDLVYQNNVCVHILVESMFWGML